MKGINTPGQALDSGGVASFSAPRDGLSHLAFPALSRERNLPADSFPLAPLGNESYSGSRISRTGVRPPSSSFLDEKRQQRLTGNIIIVFGGTNDWGQAEEPTTIEVFQEAYETLVSDMPARHKSSTLYFCTPLQRTDRGLREENIHHWNQKDLAGSIHEIVSRHEGVNLIDLASYPIKAGDGLLADGLHPSMEVLATLMQKGLGL
ncbi:SGNH/GDSL hydrolase family protein [Sphaerochaeta halotolerans]|jgi:hypothetical protein|uniref:SGNH/GDSL hydrolase family protein n=1 Tax=Sphaerochaeta halotolerans TaxID=2293840 RepID=A0A372ME11_9SPIR|nr:SGNH/GDSL hydrolase family protein [Sphaerochaeta halotolerans]MDN5334552.1 hypothetical protein [Sphaerochaeta sp.]RFU94029.1 SGNH/GDSL hydrolase family protein [Sphaerochaeta halotolerans]